MKLNLKCYPRNLFVPHSSFSPYKHSNAKCYSIKKLTRSQATYHTVSVYNFQMIGIFSRPICPPHVPICDLLVAINLSSTLGCEFLYGVFLTVVGASFIKRHPVKSQCFTSLTSLLITEPPCHSNIKLICDS